MPPPVEGSLFDDAGPSDPADPLDELRSQLAAVAGADEPGRLRLLLAAESTGALIAAEMQHDGMPWSVEAHDALLTELLGARPRGADGRPSWRHWPTRSGTRSGSRR